MHSSAFFGHIQEYLAQRAIVVFTRAYEQWLPADPEKDKSATRYDKLSFNDVISKGLKVMDMTAFTLCQENNLPIIVFDMNTPGNLANVVSGKAVGTLVS